LLDLLGEVLVPAPAAAPQVPAPAGRATAGGPKAPAADDGTSLWRQSSTGIAPLKQKK